MSDKDKIEKTGNYAPEEREQGIKAIYSPSRLQPSDNGDYVMTYTFNFPLLNFANQTNNFGIVQPADQFIERMQREIYQQISTFTNITFQELDLTQHPPVEHIIELIEANYQRIHQEYADETGLSPHELAPILQQAHKRESFNQFSSQFDNFVIIGQTPEIPTEETDGVIIGRAEFPQPQYAYSEIEQITYRSTPYYNYNPLSQYSMWPNMLHETGHSLGLLHTHNKIDNEHSITLENDPLDHKNHSVMSYFHGEYGTPITYMPWDIAALQSWYGKNTTYHAGDDIYDFGYMSEHGPQTVETIWDAGGHDRIDVSLESRSVTLNLNEGINAPNRLGNRTIFFAYGSNIEDAIAGRGDDVIIGNSLANYIKGNRGHDDITGKGGDDIFDLRPENMGDSKGANIEHPSYYEVKTYQAGQDHITDFQSAPFYEFAAERDELWVSPDVANVNVDRFYDGVMLRFYNQDGKPTNDAHVYLEGEFGTLQNVAIYRVDDDGNKDKFPWELKKFNEELTSERAQEVDDILQKHGEIIRKYFTEDTDSIDKPIVSASADIIPNDSPTRGKD